MLVCQATAPRSTLRSLPDWYNVAEMIKTPETAGETSQTGIVQTVHSVFPQKLLYAPGAASCAAVAGTRGSSTWRARSRA